jgi:hypothetical protein
MANSSAFFTVMGYNEFISYTLIVCGFTLLITASIGCTAASSKSEPLAFLVSDLKYDISSMDSWVCQ